MARNKKPGTKKVGKNLNSGGGVPVHPVSNIQLTFNLGIGQESIKLNDLSVSIPKFGHKRRDLLVIDNTKCSKASKSILNEMGPGKKANKLDIEVKTTSHSSTPHLPKSVMSACWTACNKKSNTIARKKETFQKESEKELMENRIHESCIAKTKYPSKEQYPYEREQQCKEKN